MHYPKYIEFADGSVVIFSDNLTHSHVARWIGKEAVSAGMACFPTARLNRYKFFGTSTSLDLNANEKLRLDNPMWHGGLLKNTGEWKSVVFSTDRSIAEDLCTNPHPLSLVGLRDEYDNVAYLPLVEGLNDQELARFSGLLECGVFDAPVCRVSA